MDDEELLRSSVTRLASKYGRYGDKRITALLKQEGWKVNHKRVARIWREVGLKVPVKQLLRLAHYLSNRVVPDRMVIMSRSMESLEMSF